MIRAGQEEFFIEPLERGGDMTGEEEGGSGRHHILYRSSDIKKPAISHADYFHPRGQDSAYADAFVPKALGAWFFLAQPNINLEKKNHIKISFEV